MMSQDSGNSPSDFSTRLAQWVQRRDQLNAVGADASSLDQQLLPFKNKYIQGGAIYGANSPGMVRWFAELSLDEMAPPSAATTTEIK